MAESMIERVARTLASHHYGVRFGKAADDPHVLRNVDGNWNIFLEPAMEAIKALREPTEAMCKEVRETTGFCDRSSYTRLIDAALKEHEGEKR